MRENFLKRLASLNNFQTDAVYHKGNVLVLAGAGSGKTTMATIKVGNFLEEGSEAKNILMMTFTNKAANEMAERISLLHENGKDVETSTFHAFCLKYIRNNLGLVGRRGGFITVDDKDQEAIIKILCKDASLMDKQGYGSLNDDDHPLARKIAGIKDTLTSFDVPDEVLEKKFSEAEKCVFRWYEDKLRYMNAIDFADIIRYAVASMEMHPDTIPEFDHVIVDEFQDTNASQLMLTKMVGAKVKEGGTITVVGDDDQAIYQWRGANPAGMREFIEFFNADTIRLEHNYRSTDVIVNAANQLIENNVDRLGKTMIPVNESENLIDVVTTASMHTEAKLVAKKIKKQLDEDPDADVAILYRTNRYSRSLENELLKAGIEYKMYKGLEFTKRAEVNVALRFMRLAINPRDIVSMEAVIKHFCAGLGVKTVAKVNETIEKLSPDEIFHGEGIPLKDKALKQFLWVMNLTKQVSELPLREIPHFVATACIPAINTDWSEFSYDDCEFADFSKPNELCTDNLMSRMGRFTADKGDEKLIERRMDNLDEVLCWMHGYADKDKERTLDGFIQTASIDASESNEEEDEPRVKLMTVHGSKGLEFKNVHIVGCVQGMFPGLRDEATEYNAMEEARRLFYVAATRAKEKLCITVPQTLPYGSARDHKPSMFIREINDYIDYSKDEGDDNRFNAAAKRYGRSW